MRHFLLKISESSRSRDWRLSMLPFIMGCVYLWIWHFQLPFTGRTLLLVALSLTTSTGFAALGYFINEFFDQQQDALAGKINRVAPLSSVQRLVWVSVITSVAFLPWLWLPSNNWSRVLIVIQIGLFLIYSLPFPRLKAVPFISNLVDMGYAYLVPLVLSFHTFALFAGGAYPAWFVPLAITVGLVGFRNILIHQVNDIFSDGLIGMPSTARCLGPRGTSILIYGALSLETIGFLLFGLMLVAEVHTSLLLPLGFMMFTIVRMRRITVEKAFQFNPISPLRHLNDPFYQILFPLLALTCAALTDALWLILFPFHFALLIPDSILSSSIAKGTDLRWWFVGRLPLIRGLVSAIINYPIYWLFKMFGINLIAEGVSAMTFVRRKLGQP
jgi:hypothetical protein